MELPRAAGQAVEAFTAGGLGVESRGRLGGESIFTDRDELLDRLARRALPMPSASADEIPF
jgi:hypothetical protein